MGLNFGEPAPWIVARSPTNPQYNLSAAAGRFVIMGFLPPGDEALSAALGRFAARRAMFDDHRLCAFYVVRDAGQIAKARDRFPGLRWFLDDDGQAFRAFRALDAEGQAEPHWLLLDPALRVMDRAAFDQGEAFFARLSNLAATPQDHAGVALNAPVLIVPRIFEPDLCQQLIGFYESVGGAVSGVMREVGGLTVPVVDDFKSRRDATIEDETMRQQLVARIRRRLIPEIQKAFQFSPTRIERHIVACYDAASGGYFRPHRDNTTKATMHRQFAVSINLNAEAFEGGDLRFPEFGQRTYRPPTGGAVVFSCSLLHEATPVTRGRRFAYLPFLYDEAAAKVRDANLSFLVQAKAEIPADEPA